MRVASHCSGEWEPTLKGWEKGLKMLLLWCFCFAAFVALWCEGNEERMWRLMMLPSMSWAYIKPSDYGWNFSDIVWQQVIHQDIGLALHTANVVWCAVCWWFVGLLYDNSCMDITDRVRHIGLIAREKFDSRYITMNHHTFSCDVIVCWKIWNNFNKTFTTNKN